MPKTQLKHFFLKKEKEKETDCLFVNLSEIKEVNLTGTL